MLSSSKSPSSVDNTPKKKKRKVISPSIESKSSKVVKLATQENSVRNVRWKEEEDASERKLNSSDIEIIILDDEKKDLEQSDQQKMRKGDSTPKRSLGKNKKLDRSQQKPGALTKFLKRTDKEIAESDITHDNNLSELKDKKDCQNVSVHKKQNEICSNESSDASFIRSELQDTSQLSETDDRVASKDADTSLQESDCDITILSSDNEIDKPILSTNKETDKPATPVTPKSDKDMKDKFKKLTPKQLERRQEIARRKEEKRKLKMVCIEEI